MSSFDATCSTRPRSPGCSVAARHATVLLKVAGLDMALVAVERVLRFGRGLPLVAPDHVETGAIESEMEASDACEKLRGSRAAAGLTTGREVV